VEVGKGVTVICSQFPGFPAEKWLIRCSKSHLKEISGKICKGINVVGGNASILSFFLSMPGKWYLDLKLLNFA
jgi:hypothetical protein